SSAVVTEGLYSWYTNELSMLKERLNGARTTDMDRGSRIMAYYRMLKEYQQLEGVWSVRGSAAQTTLNMQSAQKQVKLSTSPITTWSPNSDVQIANKVLAGRQ